MKNLIVARRGSYDENLNLNMVGEEQMQKLAESLKEIIGEDSILLLSSSAPCAVQSSQVLSSELGIDFESFDELWSDCDHCQNTARAMKLILNKAKSFEHVIIMTHLEYSESLPHTFAEEALDIFGHYMGSSTPKGKAWRIDCFKKTCSPIPQT